MKTIAVLHTTPVTIAGLAPQFAAELPGVKQTNFLDDTLLPEINTAGGVTPGVRRRFAALLALAAASGPDAILCACSSVGGLLEEERDMVDIPAFRIDEPMAEEAVRRGSKIAVAATLVSTLEPTMALIRRKAADRSLTLTPLLVEGAGALLATGKLGEYEAQIAARLGSALAENDVVVLAQASMANAAKRLPDWESLPILTSPQSGVAALRGVLGL